MEFEGGYKTELVRRLNLAYGLLSETIYTVVEPDRSSFISVKVPDIMENIYKIMFILNDLDPKNPVRTRPLISCNLIENSSSSSIQTSKGIQTRVTNIMPADRRLDLRPRVAGFRSNITQPQCFEFKNVGTDTVLVFSGPDFLHIEIIGGKGTILMTLNGVKATYILRRDTDTYGFETLEERVGSSMMNENPIFFSATKHRKNSPEYVWFLHDLNRALTGIKLPIEELINNS